MCKPQMSNHPTVQSAQAGVLPDRPRRPHLVLNYGMKIFSLMFVYPALLSHCWKNICNFAAVKGWPMTLNKCWPRFVSASLDLFNQSTRSDKSTCCWAPWAEATEGSDPETELFTIDQEIEMTAIWVSSCMSVSIRCLNDLTFWIDSSTTLEYQRNK